VEAAYRRGSVDNISVLVLDLRRGASLEGREAGGRAAGVKEGEEVGAAAAACVVAGHARPGMV